MPRFLLVGHGSFANRGCEAIVRTTASLLRERWPDCGITLASLQSESDSLSPAADRVHVMPYTSTSPPARWSSRWVWNQFRRRLTPTGYWRSYYGSLRPALQSADCVLSIGGDNYDYGLPSWLIAINDMASELGKPIVIWGASLGPIPDAAKRAAILRDLRRVSLITARESLTEEFLDSHGLSDRTRLVADPAFLLDPEPVDTSEFWPDGDLLLGLNVSPLLRRFSRSKDRDVFPAVAREFIRSAIRRHSLGVLLIPHVMVGNTNNDHAYMAAIAESLGREGRVCIVPPHYNACQMKHIISKCDLLVAARTHATIAGFSSGVPTISLAYSQKAHGINRDLFGDGRWVVDSRTLTTPEPLLEVLERLLDDRHTVASRLTELVPEMKARAWSALDYLAEMV